MSFSVTRVTTACSLHSDPESIGDPETKTGQRPLVLLNPTEEGVFSKTIECDISIALDPDWLVNFFPLFCSLDWKRERQDGSHVRITLRHSLEHVKKIHVVSYQTRVPQLRRTELNTCATDKSVTRYEKAARQSHSWKRHTDELQGRFNELRVSQTHCQLVSHPHLINGRCGWIVIVGMMHFACGLGIRELCRSGTSSSLSKQSS